MHDQGDEAQLDAVYANLERREKEFRVVNEIISLVNHPADLPSTLSRALDIAREALGTDIIILSLLDDEGQLSYTAWSCPPGMEEKVVAHCRSHADRELLHRALQTREIGIRDVNTAGEFLTEEQQAAYRALQVCRLAYDPLIRKGQALGVITLIRHDSPALVDLKIAFLHIIKELLAMLIENARRQRQIRELSIIKERQRLAHELHDSVTQSLFMLSRAAQGLKATLQDLPRSHHQAVELLIAQTQAVQRDMRLLIEELRPVELQQQQLKPQLRRHVKSLERTLGIAVKLVIEGDILSLPRSVQRHFNRITQEALSNIAQHAGAQHVSVKLEISPGCATLSISDDGTGFKQTN